MILIDSLYINNSGGFRLLNYLAKELTRRRADFYLLADGRCRGRLDYCMKVEYMTASMKSRKHFYIKHKYDFSSVLCFGNIPAPVKMEVPVYTYFHNINLLTLAETHGLKNYLLSWLKRQIFRHYKTNTDLWLVQTDNTARELKCHLNEPEDKIKIMPFFELQKELIYLYNVAHGNDYAYIANYTKAKGHEELLKAWTILHNNGIDRTLHLTISDDDAEFVEKINAAREMGVQIVNHGFVPFSNVLSLYKASKVLIYPSHNESLGLGIIEAVTAGCDVIGSDLPFLHSICKPSGVFDTFNEYSIVAAVEKYEKGNNEKTELRVKDHIEEIINLMVTEGKVD